MPKLKGIFRAGIGRDNIPEKKAVEKGIIIRFPSKDPYEISFIEDPHKYYMNHHDVNNFPLANIQCISFYYFDRNLYYQEMQHQYPSLMAYKGHQY